MVQSPEKSKALGLEYGEKKYYNVEQFLETFKPCPQSLYIRGHIEEGRLQELGEDLKIADKPLTYQVQDEIKYFILSPETVAKWKCGDDVSPNVPYICNGTTRRTTLEMLVSGEKTKDANFLPVPTVEVFLDDYPDDTIVYDIQIKSNDTTVHHSTVAKYRSIANLLNRKISLGIPPAEARKQCARISGFTAATVSQAEKFLDTEDMSPELIEERKKLFALLDDNRLSVDSVITIIQIVDKLGDKLELTYSKILEELSNIYPVVIKPGQTIFSKTQIANYKKQLEKKVEDQQQAAQQNGNSEDATTQNATTQNATSEETTTVTKEDIEKAKDNIQYLMPELKNTDVIEVEDIANFRNSSIKMLKVASRIVKLAKPHQYKALYENLTAIVADVLSDSEIKIEDKDLVSISGILVEVREILTKPAKKKDEEIEADDPNPPNRQNELDLQSVTPNNEKAEDEMGF